MKASCFAWRQYHGYECDGGVAWDCSRVNRSRSAGWCDVGAGTGKEVESKARRIINDMSIPSQRTVFRSLGSPQRMRLRVENKVI